MVHPSSPFHVVFEMLVGFLLLYSFFVIPVQLSFWATSGSCVSNPTQPFDMVLDMVFMFEVLYRLFVGVNTENGYCDDFYTVARLQLSSVHLFWFNAATSVPVAWLDWYFITTYCVNGGDRQGNNLQAFRIMKPLRLVKLFRLLKVSNVYRKIKEALDFHPHFYRAVRILVTMVLALHVFACILWRLKYENDPLDLDNFLHEKGLSGENKIDNYIICMYFVCTMFTTVGFGDIYAYNTIERVYCICTMLVAVCLFGVLLGELQEIVSSISRNSKEIDARVEDVSHFLIVNRVPRTVTNEVKSWIRFKYAHDQENERMNFLLKDLPSELCGRVAKTLNEKLFSKIFLFQKIHDPIDRARFAAALLPRLQFSCHPTRSVLADHRTPADKLITILTGKVAMSVPSPKHETPGQRPILSILSSGDGIGDLSVLGDLRWGGGYGVDADFIVLENTHVAFVETRDIKEVLSVFPKLWRVRKHFLKIAFAPQNLDNQVKMFCQAPELPERPRPEELARYIRSTKATFQWIDLARLSLAAQVASSDGFKGFHKPREVFTLPLNAATARTFAPPPPPPPHRTRFGRRTAVLGTLGQTFKLRRPGHSRHHPAESGMGVSGNSSNWFSDGTDDMDAASGPGHANGKDRHAVARARMVASAGINGGSSNQNSSKSSTFGRSFAWLSRASTAAGGSDAGSGFISASRVMTNRDPCPSSNTIEMAPPGAFLKAGARQTWPGRPQERLPEKPSTADSSSMSGFDRSLPRRKL